MSLSSPLTTPPTRPEAVIFDWDNTLANTDTAIYAAINETLSHFHKPLLDFAVFRQKPQHSPRDSFPALFGSHAQEAEKQFYAFLAGRTSEIHPMNGAQELLERLADTHMPMGVVSNKNGDVLREEIRQFGWSSFFPYAIGSRDTPHDKPSPTPLLHLLDKLQLAPSTSVWFLGDSSVDLECASKAGCLPVAIHQATPYSTIPHLALEDCSHALSLLQKLL